MAFATTIRRGNEIGNVTGWTFGDGQPIQFGDGTPITISIGTPSDGLDLQTRIDDVTVRRRIEAGDIKNRIGIYAGSLLVLEDGTGYWTFESDARIMFESGDTNEQTKVKRRIDTLRVNRG